MFSSVGGSLRQAHLRLHGAVLGSAAGYVISLSCAAWVVVPALAAWSFASCLFRGSQALGYASIVAAWTAVIVATSANAQVSGLERILHTTVGVAALVLTLASVFPVWARDVARDETVGLLQDFEELYDSLQKTWVGASHQMTPSSKARSEAPLLDRRRNGGGGGALHEDEESPVDRRSSEDDDELARVSRGVAPKSIAKRLCTLRSLVAEASMEPALWRTEYQAAASRALASHFDAMLAALQQFESHVSHTASVLPRVLEDAANDATLTRWLSTEWVLSLEATNREIARVLTGVRAALLDGAATRSAGTEASYFNAIRVQGLEQALQRELARFLARYDAILSGAISESQLDVLAGNATAQRLSNLDMLFYNSLVFATKAFVDGVLKCSRAVRELVLLDVIVDAAGAAESDALASPPWLIQDRLNTTTSTQPQQPPSSSQAGVVLVLDESEDEERANDKIETQTEEELLITVVGPDRVGIVFDVARLVYEHGGSVAASRMIKVDSDFAVIMKATVLSRRLDAIEAALKGQLRGGLRVIVKRARMTRPNAPAHTAEVHCVCPRDAPGLLMPLAAALADLGLNIVALDTERRTTPSGDGFIMHATVESPDPIDKHILLLRLESLGGADGATIVATIF